MTRPSALLERCSVCKMKVRSYKHHYTSVHQRSCAVKFLDNPKNIVQVVRNGDDELFHCPSCDFASRYPRSLQRHAIRSCTSKYLSLRQTRCVGRTEQDRRKQEKGRIRDAPTSSCVQRNEADTEDVDMNLERDDLEDDEATSDQASVCQNEEDVEGHAEDVTLPDLPQEDGTTERDLNHAESRAAELTEELDIMDLEQFHLEWPEELDDDSPVSDATSEPHARVLHSPTAALAHHSTEVEPVYLSSLSHPPDLDTTSPPLDRSHHTDQLETIGAASLLLPRSRDSTSKSGRQSSPPVVQPKSRSARLACLADVLSDLGFDSDALLNALSCTEDEWDPVNKMVIKRGRFADWIHLKKRLRARAAKVSSHSSRNIDEGVNAKPPPRGVVESFVNILSSSDRHAYLVAMFSDLGFDAEDVLDDLCGMEEEWAVIKENIIRLGGQFAFADWVLVKWGLRTRAARLQATASDS